MHYPQQMEQFVDAMTWLYAWLMQPISLWGYTFSLFELGLYYELGDILMTFLGRMMGKEEVQSE